MTTTVRARCLLAATLLLASVSLLAVHSIGSARAAGEQLLPDLVTVDPGSNWLSLDRKRKAQKLVLHLDNSIGNQGVGPLELRATTQAQTPGDCIADGLPTELFRGVTQRVFVDSDNAESTGYFERSHDNSGATNPEIGCYFFHDAPGHQHWHFQGFAEYRLETLGGDPVGIGSKVGFCVLDGGTPFNPSPTGTPEDRHYPTGPDPESRGSCNESDDPVTSQGLSIGYEDTYRMSLPGQSVNVSNAGKGNYCLVSEANPDGLMIEADYTNNERRRLVRLRPKQEQVSDLGPC